MSPETVTFERIYARLKGDVIGGRYPPRSEIVIATIAREYGVSIAPVRDGAQRLVGERLLAPLRRGGFAIPDLTEAGLHDLLFWHGHLLRIAVKLKRTDSFPARETGHDFDTNSEDVLAKIAASLFHKLAMRAQNSEIAPAVLAAGDRLHAVRLREPEHLPGVAQELETVQALAVSGRDQDLIQGLWAYHRRRLRRVRQLVEAAGGTLQPLKTAE